MAKMIDIIRGHANRLVVGALNLLQFAAEGDAKRIRLELEDLIVEIEDAIKYMEGVDDGHES